MNVSVTVGAFLPDIPEYELYVALRALQFFMHATQGVARLVVLEFRGAANGSPAQRCVAVLTRNIE